jgi:branched-chain amino acid transport system substrate-binding protein
MNIRALAYSFLVLALALCVGCTPLENAENTVKSAGDTFKIGCIFPLSGTYAKDGNGCLYAAQLAVDEINESGGADGIKFELISADDEGNSEGAADAYAELYDKGVNAVVSSFIYDSAIISTEKSNEDGILNVLPNGSINSCEEYKTSVCINYTYAAKGRKMFDLMEDDGCKRTAVLYDDSIQSQLISSSFKENSNDALNVVYSGEIDTSNEGGAIRAQLKDMRANAVDSLFLPVDIDKAEDIMQVADKLGMDIKIYGLDSWAMSEDKNITEGTKISVPFTAENESAFTNKYLEDNVNLPDFYAAEVYDGIYAMKQAVEVANGDISNEMLIGAAKKAEINGLTGSLNFNADGSPLRKNITLIYKDGKFTTEK